MVIHNQTIGMKEMLQGINCQQTSFDFKQSWKKSCHPMASHSIMAIGYNGCKALL